MYTYDQFQRAATERGLLGEFSDADLALAKSNPDAGMSLLQYKQDYRGATTDEARALANLGAEEVRRTYGNYTAGESGSGYYIGSPTPQSFTAETAPTYKSSYAGEIADLYDRQKNYGEYSYGVSAPVYQNRYDDTVQKLLSEVINREDFSYDASSDPLYSQYRKAYAREGARASADALGAAAAASGGIPSSYAAVAASQAGDYYASQMTDKIPELYELAYNKYLNEYNMKLSDLSAVQGAEASDYDKYLTQLQQYNTDRNFDYGVWSDGYNRLQDQMSVAQGLEQMEYEKYLTKLQQYNTDRNFDYGVHLDEIDYRAQERAEALDRAQFAAAYGDYSGLREMGVDTSVQERLDALNRAQFAAGYGDYAELKALGITPSVSTDNYERQVELAKLAAEYGDYSGLLALGIVPDGYDPDGGKPPIAPYDEEDYAKAKEYYGSVVSEAQWNEMIAGGATEAGLLANGFTKNGETGAAPGGGVLSRTEWYRMKYDRDGTTENYAAKFDTYEDYLDFMKGEGAV